MQIIFRNIWIFLYFVNGFIEALPIDLRNVVRKTWVFLGLIKFVFRTGFFIVYPWGIKGFIIIKFGNI